MKSGKKNLFEEFPPVTAQQWREKIIADLKGDDYNKLITKTLEGIDIQPFYHRETYSSLPFDYYPASFKIIRPWDFVPSAEQQRRAWKEQVDGQRFPYKGETRPVFAGKKNFIVDLETPSRKAAEELAKEGILFNFNPLTHLLSTGNWYKSEAEDKALALDMAARYPQMFIEIDMSLFRNAGGNIVQQLAFGLAQAREWLAWGGESMAPRIRFKTAVGYHYFFEIAKFKALRYLWKKISGRKRAIIYAVPSLRNKTLFDPYVNMLRTGMEMMAAVLGGADETGNYPYNYIYKSYDENAMRLASNQLLILREEAGMERLRDAGKDAYYIEQIAVELARKALELWKKTEKEGGFLKGIYSGSIQNQINRNAAKEQALFDEGKLILTGTNKYILENEQPPETDKDPFAPPVKKGIIEPLTVRRLAEKAERERLKKNAKP